jgi:hypothetical protein
VVLRLQYVGLAMSRGSGHVERTIVTLIERAHASHQPLHFDVFDIAEAAYPEKKLTKAQEVVAASCIPSPASIRAMS